MRTQSQPNKLPKARTKVREQVVVGFSFACDWFTEWREFSGPITERRKAQPKQLQTTFDTQLKIWSVMRK